MVVWPPSQLEDIRLRKIDAGPIMVFTLLFGLAIFLGWASTKVAFGLILRADEGGAGWFVAVFAFSYAYAMIFSRLHLQCFPLKAGAVVEGSKEEFHYHVYLLFYLSLFQPLTRGYVVPVPIMRLIYLALGARLGENTYSAGTILDPPLTVIGDNTIVGHDALIFSHIVEGSELILAPVQIGSNVTIGAKAVIMPGVSIEDGAIISVGAVVRKYSVVGAGQVWVGNPAVMKRQASHSPLTGSSGTDG